VTTETKAASPADKAGMSHRLLEVVSLFLKLGFTAFGGPAAHIGMMHAEVVKKRKWVSEQHFLDLLGATNLIPGPNSTEMAIHLGFLRAGWPGLILGGLCFILPAMLMVLGLAWVYVQYGTTPAAGWLLYGIKPVIIGVILDAILNLGRRAVKDIWTGAAGLSALGLYFLGVNELVLLFGAGLVVMVIKNAKRLHPSTEVILFPWAGFAGSMAGTAPFQLGTMFLAFLKIGALLYGGGYVLLAFLRADFVIRYGWLTDQQLIDAVAVGQVTPGPLFTTATFIGYLLGGVPGALLATAGIFLPSFIFVALSNPLIPRLQGSPWTRALLDGVNAAAIGLMVGVSIQLAGAAFVDPLTIAMGIASFVIVWRWKVNATWLVLAGAIVGVIRALFA